MGIISDFLKPVALSQEEEHFIRLTHRVENEIRKAMFVDFQKQTASLDTTKLSPIRAFADCNQVTQGVLCIIDGCISQYSSQEDRETLRKNLLKGIIESLSCAESTAEDRLLRTELKNAL